MTIQTIQDYIYIIGSTDDFNDIDALLEAYNDGTLREYNASVYRYDAPVGDVGMMSGLEIAELIGYGMAFEDGWCMDDTVSYLMAA